jgi:hypothetical protein
MGSGAAPGVLSLSRRFKNRSHTTKFVQPASQRHPPGPPHGASNFCRAWIAGINHHVRKPDLPPSTFGVVSMCYGSTIVPQDHGTPPFAHPILGRCISSHGTVAARPDHCEHHVSGDQLLFLNGDESPDEGTPAMSGVFRLIGSFVLFGALAAP